MTIRFFARAALLLALVLAWSAPAWAQAPSQAQRDAIRQACPADYQAHCAGVPTGGKAALACLQQHAASLSATCQRAVKAASGGAPKAAAAPAAAAAAAPAAAAAAAPVAAQPAPPMSPRQELIVLRQSCAGDYRAWCGGVPVGGGRAIACLRANAASLSPPCGRALSAARANR